MTQTLRHRTLYCLVGLPVGIAAFTAGVTLFSLGLSTLIVWVGLPILVATLTTARYFALLERTALREWVDADAPTPRYAPRSGPGVLQRWWGALRDPQGWLDLLHSVIRLPLSIVSFTLAVSWWALAIGGLSYPLWGWAVPRGPGYSDLPELLGFGDSYLVDSVFYLAVGVVALVTLRPMISAATWIQAGPALALLSGRAAMEREVDEARASRDAGRVAEAASLRRLERDIHDGPQQQLVRLSMDLGRVRRQLRDDPERASLILDEAIARSGQTLDDLRALSRGIAPPLLADRGLTAALQEIADRAPVPVSLACSVGALPEHVETTAYFVVSEALTNLAKHSLATRGFVTVEAAPGALLVEVTDDGIGGAHLAKGTGLAGLVERVRSVDGTLEVDSPVGGPTTVRAEIPCG